MALPRGQLLPSASLLQRLLTVLLLRGGGERSRGRGGAEFLLSVLELDLRDLLLTTICSLSSISSSYL
jgi:hypothetical protein